MALGVITVTQVERRTVLGDRRAVVASLSATDNYETGGFVLTPAMFGLQRIDILIMDPVWAAPAGATGVVPKFDYTNNKLQCFEGSAAGTALSEKTNAEAMPASATLRVIAVGV